MARIFDLKDKKFSTIDGRELKVKDYFSKPDFVTDEGGKADFVKHDALMRVCKVLFTIRSRDVEIVQAPNKQNGMVAAATVSYTLEPKEDKADSRDYYTYQSSADYGPHNELNFGNASYPTAMAETRASARALRFLLGVEFCSKEEINSKTEEHNTAEISTNQLMLLGKNKVQVSHARHLLKMEELESLKDLDYDEASKLINLINTIRGKKLLENKEA